MSEYRPSSELFSVATYSYRDTYAWYSSAYSSVGYDRIMGLEIERVDSRKVIGEISEDYTKKYYELSESMIDGLRVAMSRIALKEPINCNLFSRLLHPEYVDLALSKPLGESWYPIAKYAGVGEQIETLEKGQIGFVVLGSRGPVHSLVGVDAEADLSIQVMSHGAELAIVSNEALLRFYTELNPETNVGLYTI